MRLACAVELAGEIRDICADVGEVAARAEGVHRLVLHQQRRVGERVRCRVAAAPAAAPEPLDAFRVQSALPCEGLGVGDAVVPLVV